MNTLNDQLKNWKNKNQLVIAQKKIGNSVETSKNNRGEKLTEKDIQELMGMNRPRYEKRKGAIRQSKR